MKRFTATVDVGYEVRGEYADGDAVWQREYPYGSDSENLASGSDSEVDPWGDSSDEGWTDDDY
jgi:hypothetical protein